MAQIMVAISDETFDREVMQLTHYPHNVVRWNQLTTTDLPPVCILDPTLWEQINRMYADREWYRLLLVQEHDLPRLPSHIIEQVDDVLIPPLHPTEFNIRVRNLLRMTEQSEQQRRIYEKLAVTNKALESTSDGIIIADNAGVSIYVNPAFIDTFGYTANELNVAGIPNILFRKPTVGNHVFQTVNREGSWKGEVELKTKQGRVVSFLLNIDSIHNEHDQPIGFISICSDISQHKRLSLFQEEQRILARAQLDTATALTSTLDLNEVFERMLENISKVVPNDAANIILIEGGKTQLVDRDDYAERAQIEALKSGETDVYEFDDLRAILELNEPLVIPDTWKYRQEHPEMRKHTPWLNSHIGIPIRLQDTVIGFLNVDSIQPGLFNQEHARRLQLFAEHAAIAIHNARLHERAQMLAMMEERQRLARNLHDAVSQTLFSASIIAEALPQLWEQNPEAVMDRLEQIRSLNQGALAEMRTLLLELHPERLTETPMHELMAQFAEGMLGRTQINVTMDIQPNLELQPDIHVAAYYITQEALNNVIKHAEATQVSVRLHKHSDLCLCIRDDGKGFDTEQISSTSLGINNIRERACATQAELQINSSPGGGTEIRVSWPD